MSKNVIKNISNYTSRKNDLKKKIKKKAAVKIERKNWLAYLGRFTGG